MVKVKDSRFLAVDMGAESARAIVGTVGEERIHLEELHRFPSRNAEVQGRRYWDILYIFGEITSALQTYANQCGPTLEGIGVDSWGVDFGVLGESGQLLQNPVHYRDHRTDGILEKAFEVMPRERIYEITGIQFMPINSLYQLWAMRNTAPEVLREARTFLMIPDIIHYFLCGKEAVEYTLASTSQILDVHARTWSTSLLDTFNIPANIFPKIIQPGAILGEIDPALGQQLGIEQAKVVAPCTHDTASAVAAVPATTEDFVYISCGTWSLFGTELAAPCVSADALRFNFTNEGGIAGTIRFLKNIIGLWVIQQARAAWLRQGRAYDYAELTKAACGESPFQAVLNIDDPTFLNPANMVDAIAAQCNDTGQKMPETPGAITRIILEGLALRYALVLADLETTTGKRYDTIHMIGGGIKNELLSQLTADATGRRVVAGPTEATAMGNVLSQAMGVGHIKDLAEARRYVANSTDLKAYTPQQLDAWQPVFAKYRELYGT